MCANCGYPSAPGHWTEAGASSASERLQARFRRAAMLKEILPAYGLTAHDDGAVPGMTLATMTGNHEMVGDLAELWAAAERMTGRRIDPLAPEFLCTDADRTGEG